MTFGNCDLYLKIISVTLYLQITVFDLYPLIRHRVAEAGQGMSARTV